MSDQSLNGLLCRIADELVRQGIPLQQAKREFERLYLVTALRQCAGNLSRSAEVLGVHRNTLRNKIEALGISAKEVAPRRRSHRSRG